MLRGARILVTGAAGFVGFHAAQALLAEGAEVTGVDSLNAYYDPALKQARLARLEGRPGFRFHHLDLAEQAPVDALFGAAGFDYVLHLAAQAGVRYSLDQPRAYLRSNMDGFLNILEACRAHPPRHVVYASSSSVYGGNARLPFSEHDGADHPVSLYAATKRANELMAHCYAHLFRTPLTGLRFFTVYGPWGRPDMAYWKFTAAILRGQPIDVYDAANMSRDFTYIDDVVAAVVRLLPQPAEPDARHGSGQPDPARSDAPFRVYNIGNHAPVALLEFIRVIEEACGRPAILRHLPRQPGDVPATYADVRDLAAAVDFAPRTPIAEGIGRFVAWYRGFHGV